MSLCVFVNQELYHRFNTRHCDIIERQMKAGDWNWSSYNSMANNEDPLDFLTIDWILGQFSLKKMIAQENYRKFVESGIEDKTDPWDSLKGQVFFGSEEFIHSIKMSKKKDGGIKEVPKIQRHANRVGLKDLFQGVNDKMDRNEKVWKAHVQYGYKMKEIADYLSIHYTTISKIINKIKK
jgi:putative transposase